VAQQQHGSGGPDLQQAHGGSGEGHASWQQQSHGLRDLL
jgi:hypothetical protein